MRELSHVTSQADRSFPVSRITASIRVESLHDIWEAEAGIRRTSEIRKIDVPSAVVNDDFLLLALPKRVIDDPWLPARLVAADRPRFVIRVRPRPEIKPL